VIDPEMDTFFGQARDIWSERNIWWERDLWRNKEK